MRFFIALQGDTLEVARREDSTLMLYPSHATSLFNFADALGRAVGGNTTVSLQGVETQLQVRRLRMVPLSFFAEVEHEWLNVGGRQRDRPVYRGTAPTTGLLATLWALGACSTVSLYGFGRVEGRPVWYYTKRRGSNDKDTYAGDPDYHDAVFETALLRELEDARLLWRAR